MGTSLFFRTWTSNTLLTSLHAYRCNRLHKRLKAGGYGKPQRSPFYQMEEFLLRTVFRTGIHKLCFSGPFALRTVGRENPGENGKVFILG